MMHSKKIKVLRMTVEERLQHSVVIRLGAEKERESPRPPLRVEPMLRQYDAAYPHKPSPVQTIRVLQPLPIERHTRFWMASVLLVSGERRELAISPRWLHINLPEK